MPRTAITITERIELGPAMKRLNDRQRAFVVALCMSGGENRAQAARDAGYSDASGRAKEHAHWLMHNPLVQAAILEYGKGRLAGSLGEALDQLDDIARTPGPSQLGAVKTKLGLAGLMETIRHEHQHTVTHTFEQKADEYKRLMAALGRQIPDDLAPVLEGEYEDVTEKQRPQEAEEPVIW